MYIIDISRLRASETIQFFQFDSKGNMYVFPAGSGINGVPTLVTPGDEMIFNTNSYDSQVSDSQESGFFFNGVIES